MKKFNVVFVEKVILIVSIITIISSISFIHTTHANNIFTHYADILANSGVIAKQSTEAGYNLDNNITRAEMAKIAVNIKKSYKTECTGKVFSDVTPKFGVLCKYIEAAANAGIVNANATNFRPMDFVTRAEMIKIILGANGISRITENQGFKDLGSDAGLNGYINAAAKAGIIKKTTFFNPNNTATRGEVFKIVVNSSNLTFDNVPNTTDVAVTDLGFDGEIKRVVPYPESSFIDGWIINKNNFDEIVNFELKIDDNVIGEFKSNMASMKLHRDPLKNRGFFIKVPEEYRDGQNHKIEVLAIDSITGKKQKLLRSPKSFKILKAGDVITEGVNFNKKLVSKKGASSSAWFGGEPDVINSLNPGWYYTWNITPINGVNSDIQFVPMISGLQDSQENRDGIDGKNTKIKNDINYINKLIDKIGNIPFLLIFNEPNIPRKGNTPRDSIDTLNAFSRDKVSNISTSALARNFFMEWNTEFFNLAKENNTRFDFIPIHTYPGGEEKSIEEAGQNLLDLVDDTYIDQGKPIWLTEFALADWSSIGSYKDEKISDNKYSEEDVLAFMKKVLPELESRPYVYRYAWFNFSPTGGEQGIRSNLHDKDYKLTKLGEYYANFDSKEIDASKKIIFNSNKVDGYVNIIHNRHVYGWAIDRDDIGKKIDIKITIDGNTLSIIKADKKLKVTPSTIKIRVATKNIKNQNSFSFDIPNLYVGKHTIKVYGIDLETGNEQELSNGTQIIDL